MANRIMLNETSYHGAGAIQEIATEAKAHGFQKAFVCSDPDLIKFGVTKKVTDVLDKNGLVYEIYSDIKPNPTIQNVQHGVQAFKDSGDIPIYMMDELDDYCKKNKVDIAALTLPKEKAEDTAQHLVNLGIRAIWNFAHVDLDLSDKSVVVENVHLSDSLMQLSYNIVKNSK